MANIAGELRELRARTSNLEVLCARLTERLQMIGLALVGGDGQEPGGSGSSKRPADQQESLGGIKPAGDGKRSATRQPGKKSRGPASADAELPKTASKKRTNTTKAAPKKSTSQQQMWFKKDEAVELFRRILKQPMKSRQLMAGVIRAKRKAELPKPDMERFRWAVQAALKQSIKRGFIVRQEGGLLAATAVGAPVDASVPTARENRAHA